MVSMADVNDLKGFTLCEKCNQGMPLALAEDNSGIYTASTKCPKCGAYNHRWIKLVRVKTVEQKEMKESQ